MISENTPPHLLPEKLDFFVLSHGKWPHLKQSLNSLAEQFDCASGTVTVFLTKSVSPPPIPWAAPTLWVRVATAAKARNIALDQARYTNVLILDEDVILPKGFLQRATATLKQNPAVDLFSGSYQSSPESSYWGHAYNAISRLWQSRGGYLWHPKIVAGIMLVRKGFARNSRFPSDPTFGGEEDLFLEQCRANKTVYLVSDQLDVFHNWREPFSTFARRAQQQSWKSTTPRDQRCFFRFSDLRIFFEAKIPLRLVPAIFIFFVIQRLNSLCYAALSAVKGRWLG